MNPTQGTHWMCMTGLDDTYIYVNDPGRSAESNGKNAKYTLSTFATSFASTDCKKRVVVIMPKN